MGAFLIALNQLTQQGEGMIVRRYGKKHGDGGMVFNAVICLFAAVFFVIKDVVIEGNGLVFTKGLVTYGLISCVLYATGFYTMYIALRVGSFAMARMIASFSGTISILGGVVFLHETPGTLGWIAIVLMVLSVVLMRCQRKTSNKKTSLSLKWLICALLSAISNGFISVVQRKQQLEFGGAYDNEFMLISFTGACVILLLLSVWKERDTFLSTIKYGISYGAIAGLLNGATNFLNLAIIWTIGSISAAVPIRSGVGMVVSFAISVLIYKEKFTKIQVVSAIIGISAIVLFKFA